MLLVHLDLKFVKIEFLSEETSYSLEGLERLEIAGLHFLLLALAEANALHLHVEGAFILKKRIKLIKNFFRWNSLPWAEW